MNRKRVNLTIEENWLKIAKKYAIDNNTSLSRLFETALKNMMRIEEEKELRPSDLEKATDKILKKVDDSKDEMKKELEKIKNKLSD